MDARCQNCGNPLLTRRSSLLCPACAFAGAIVPEETPHPSSRLRPVSAAAFPGATLCDDYVILEEIGRGGMGIVFKARQRSLDRLVAVKMIRDGCFATPEMRRRFVREARAAAALRHPRIV